MMRSLLDCPLCGARWRHKTQTCHKMQEIEGIILRKFWTNTSKKRDKYFIRLSLGLWDSVPRQLRSGTILNVVARTSIGPRTISLGQPKFGCSRIPILAHAKCQREGHNHRARLHNCQMTFCSTGWEGPESERFDVEEQALSAVDDNRRRFKVKVVELKFVEWYQAQDGQKAWRWKSRTRHRHPEWSCR
jgi:hypothetical protein